jgi:hypothetical protein
MIYEELLRASEAATWSVETGVRWTDINRDMARSEPLILASLRDAAMIEGYLPTFAPRLMLLLWDDLDATAILSLELYEGLKHYTALKRYLDIVGDESASLSESSVVSAREKAADTASYERGSIVTHLTHFMCSELFAAHFFRRLSEQTREPVLEELLRLMAKDELRHSAGAAALLKKRIDVDRSVVTEVLAAADNFRHYGSDVVEIPIAEANDFQAIMAMNRQVRQLCGLAVTDHILGELNND